MGRKIGDGKLEEDSMASKIAVTAKIVVKENMQVYEFQRSSVCA